MYAVIFFYLFIIIILFFFLQISRESVIQWTRQWVSSVGGGGYNIIIMFNDNLYATYALVCIVNKKNTTLYTYYIILSIRTHTMPIKSPFLHIKHPRDQKYLIDIIIYNFYYHYYYCYCYNIFLKRFIFKTHSLSVTSFFFLFFFFF